MTLVSSTRNTSSWWVTAGTITIIAIAAVFWTLWWWLPK
jgi:hypothetical protein